MIKDVQVFYVEAWKTIILQKNKSQLVWMNNLHILLQEFILLDRQSN